MNTLNSISFRIDHERKAGKFKDSIANIDKRKLLSIKACQDGRKKKKDLEDAFYGIRGF